MGSAKCLESYLGDLDTFFAYRTPRVVAIRDRRLGIALLALQLIIAGYVVIYQGIRESFGPFVFSREYQRTDIVVSELNTYQQQLVERSISGDSFADISEKLSILREVGK